MQTLVLVVTALISVPLILGCSEKTPTTPPPVATSSISNSATAKSNSRTVMIKSLEARAAKSDPDAQLSLAKALLDGSEIPPDYERVKELLLGAAGKGIPEAIFGLWRLRSLKAINDDRLPEAKILKEQALATGDPFVTQFFFIPIYLNPIDPPELLVKSASSGYPLASAKMADYYGQMAYYADICRQEAALKMKRSASELGKCLRVSRIPDSFQRAITYASAILDAHEIDADKMRFWRRLSRRIATSPATVSGLPPLAQMYLDHVLGQLDPYSVVIASALSQAGKILKNGNGGPSDPYKAMQFLKRAAELGDSAAQNMMGELYKSGRGVPKDFEMAARYYAQSAQQGQEDSAQMLGLAFASGRGVERNDVHAYFWLSIAALGIDSQSTSAELRDKLARTMKAEEISEAQRLTREWRPSYQVGSPPTIASFSAGARSGSGNTGVLAKKSTGTVFVVSTQSLAVTNHHVIDGCTELRIEGREGLAKRITVDAVNDLALIQIPGAVAATATIAGDSTKLRQGEDIVVFGFPLNAVLSSGGNLTPGVVSALTGLGNNTNQIQITASIQPGSSGSPVLNKKSEVVGVVSMKLSDSKMAKATGSVGQNVNFAVNSQTLKTFLDTHKVAYRNGAGFLSLDKSPADLADEARKWTLAMECWK